MSFTMTEYINKVHKKVGHADGEAVAAYSQLLCLIEEISEVIDAFNDINCNTEPGIPGGRFLRVLKDHLTCAMHEGAVSSPDPTTMRGFYIRLAFERHFAGVQTFPSMPDFLKELADVVWCALALMDRLGYDPDVVCDIVGQNNFDKVKDGVNLDPVTKKYLKPAGYVPATVKLREYVEYMTIERGWLSK